MISFEISCTYMDNAAFHSERIADYANLLTGDPNEGVERLRELDVDFVLLYFTGIQHPTSESCTMLGFGDDLSKMGWIMRIGDRNPDDYIDSNGLLNNKFYTDTLYGRFVPFSPLAEEVELIGQIDGMSYPWQRTINPETGQLYQYGWYAYNPTKNVNGMRMGYVSSEFEVPEDKAFNAIVIYQVLK